MTNIAKAAVKEKVTRVVVATLRVSCAELPRCRRSITEGSTADYQNLLYIAPTQNLPSMFTTKLLPFVTSLKSRQWSDEEIIEDIDYLKDELNAKLDGLT